MNEAVPVIDTLEQLDAVLAGDAGAVIVLFGSTSCPWCCSFAPVFEGLAREFGDSPVRLCTVQVDRDPQLARPFRLESAPTMLFFVDGKLVDATVGRIDEAGLRKKTQSLIEQAGGDGLFSRLFAGVRRRLAS